MTESEVGPPTGHQSDNVDPDLPPMKVVHVLDACRCQRCGTVCPNCLVTDESRGNVKETARNFTLPDPNASPVEGAASGRST